MIDPLEFGTPDEPENDTIDPLEFGTPDEEMMSDDTIDPLEFGTPDSGDVTVPPPPPEKLETPESGNFMRGLKGGFENLQATAYGGLGLAQQAVGADEAAQRSFEGYQRNTEEARKYKTDVEKFTDIDWKSTGSIADYIAGTMGNLTPSIIESLVGAGLGAAVGTSAGGVGAVPGAVAGFASKTGVRKLIRNRVAKEMKTKAMKEIAKKQGRAKAREAANRIAMSKIGSAIGVITTTGIHEGGGMWGEDATEHGVENANWLSAGVLGSISGVSELVAPGGRFARGAFGKGGAEFLESLGKSEGKKLFTRLGIQIPKNMGGEFAQESFQEFLGKINEKITDTTGDVELFDREAMKGYFNAGMAGAVGGGLFGTAGAIRTPGPISSAVGDDTVTPEPTGGGVTPDGVYAVTQYIRDNAGNPNLTPEELAEEDQNHLDILNEIVNTPGLSPESEQAITDNQDLFDHYGVVKKGSIEKAVDDAEIVEEQPTPTIVDTGQSDQQLAKSNAIVAMGDMPDANLNTVHDSVLGKIKSGTTITDETEIAYKKVYLESINEINEQRQREQEENDVIREHLGLPTTQEEQDAKEERVRSKDEVVDKGVERRGGRGVETDTGGAKGDGRTGRVPTGKTGVETRGQEKAKEKTGRPSKTRVRGDKKTQKGLREVRKPVKLTKLEQSRIETDFVSNVRKTLKDPTQTKAVVGIMNARAKSLGMTTGQYIKSRGIQVIPDSKIVDKEGKPLSQRAKGAVTGLDDGVAIIHAFKRADVSTMIHEIGHIFRRDLTAGELSAAEKWVGAKPGAVWNREQEEQFARGWENYITTGQAPNAELKSIFDKLKNWMLGIYGSLTHKDINVDVTPEIRKVFDSLISGKAVDVRAVPVKQIPGTPKFIEGASANQSAVKKMIKGIGDAAIPIGDMFLFQQDPQKWDTPPVESIEFGTVNNRMSKELEVLEDIIGPVPEAEMLPGKLVGTKRPETRTIRQYEFGTIIHRLAEDGTLARWVDPNVTPEMLAKERGLKPEKTKKGDSPWEKMIERLEGIRKGSHFFDDETLKGAQGKQVLSNNGKAEASIDLLLGTCQPTEPCKVCYAAASMIRFSAVMKAFRNTVQILADPKRFGRMVALEAGKIPKTQLPFIRLLGSGDMTSTETVDAFNELAKHADRPIHIFSRHHDNLKKLKGTQVAPFKKMGSVDAQIFSFYGKKALIENFKKYKIDNAFLFTDESEIPMIESLRKKDSIGRVFASSLKLHKKMSPEARKLSCPCDAEERTYFGSCRRCATSGSGCWKSNVGLGVDSKGEIWNLDDIKAPDSLLPILDGMFMVADKKGMEGIDPRTASYASVVLDQLKKSIELINLHIRNYNGEKIDKKTGELVIDPNPLIGIGLKDIRFPKDNIRYVSIERWKGEPRNAGKPIPKDTTKTRYVPGAEVLANAEAYKDMLEGQRDLTIESGTFELPSEGKGEIEPTVRYKDWKQVDDSDILMQSDIEVKNELREDTGSIKRGTQPRKISLQEWGEEKAYDYGITTFKEAQEKFGERGEKRKITLTVKNDGEIDITEVVGKGIRSIENLKGYDALIVSDIEKLTKDIQNLLERGASDVEAVGLALVYHNESDILSQDGLSDIENKWEDQGVKLHVYERPEEIHIQTVIVPKDKRKRGVGSNIMTDIINYADSMEKRITVTPADKDDFHGTTSKARLKRFYKRFGFVENKGRNKDFTVNARDMYREPVVSPDILLQDIPLTHDEVLDTERFLEVGLKIGKKAKIYRGVSETSGSHAAKLGHGLYTTTDRKQASKYGKILNLTQNDIPKNPIRFDNEMAFENWMNNLVDKLGFRRISDFEKEYGSIDSFLSRIAPEIDGVQIGTGHGTFFVKYPDKSVDNRGTFDPTDPNIYMQADTDSPAFKRWFGDSKVVDEDGEPLVVYHGTSGEFDEFEIEGTEGAHFGTKQAAIDRIGHRNIIEYNVEEDDGVFYVIPDNGSLQGKDIGSFRSQKDADEFIEKQPDRIPLYEVYLSLENLIPMRDLGTWGVHPLIRELPTNLLSKSEINEIYSAEVQIDEFRKKLMNKGYDGVVYTNTEEDQGSTSYIVFDSVNIKSVDNRGTFDPTDPNIYYQKTAQTSNLNATIDGVQSDATPEHGAEIIAEMLRKLKAVAVPSQKKRFGDPALMKLVTSYRKAMDFVGDPLKSAAKKQQFLSTLAVKVPQIPRSKLLKPLYAIVQVSGQPAQERKTRAFLKTADAEMTKYLRKQMKDKIDKAVKSLKKKKGVQRGRGYRFERDLKYIREHALNFDKDRIETEVNHQQNKITSKEELLLNPKIGRRAKVNAEEAIADAESRTDMADLFGNLGGKTFDEMLIALESLQEMIAEGRASWRAVREAEQAHHARNTASAIESITGDPLAQPEDAGAAARREEKRKKPWGRLKEMMSAASNSIMSWEIALDKISGRAKAGTLKSWLVKHMSSVAHFATRNYEIMQQTENGKILERAMEIFGAKNNVALGKIFAKLDKVEHDKVSLYPDGKKSSIPMSPLQAAYWYGLWKAREQPAIGDTFEAMGVTGDTMADIEKMMSPELKEYSDWIVGEYLQDFHEGISTVHRQMYGIDLAKSEDYMPLHREVTGKVEDRQREGLLAGKISGSVAKGGLHSRVYNIKRFKRMNINDVLIGHITDMNHFKAWALPSREINGTFNKPEIQGFIKQYYGQSSARMIRFFQERFVQSPNEMHDQMQWIDKWRGNVATSMVGANPVVFFKQLTSIPAFAADIPAAQWIKHSTYALRNPLKAWKLLSTSPILKARGMRGHDKDVVAAGRTTGSGLIAGATTWPNKLMVLTKLGDKMAIIVGGYPVYKYHLDKAVRTGKTSKQAHDIAIIEFEKSFSRSQQSSNVQDLGWFLQKDPMTRLFTLFMTSPASYSRQVFMAIRHRSDDPKDAIKRLGIYGVVLPVMFQIVADALLLASPDDDDQERTVGRTLGAIAKGPLNGLPIIRTVSGGAYEASTGNQWLMNQSYSPLTELAKTPTKAIYYGGRAIRDDDDEYFTKMMWEVMNSAGIITGMPLKNVKRIWDGWDESLTGDTDHPIAKFLGYSDYAVGE